MKLRNGFVSNSSSCSFTIYGVNLGYISYDGIQEMYSKVSSLFAKEELIKNEFIIEENEKGESILGVGHCYTEYDHYKDNWEDFVAPEPKEESKIWVKDLLKKLSLGNPELFSETFWR